MTDSTYIRKLPYYDDAAVLQHLPIDVYDVLTAFGVTCPATQHAIKKLLCAGTRGHKDAATDLAEALTAIQRAIELHEVTR